MLKTSCQSCIFNPSLGKCDIEKGIIIDNQNQFTLGFCRHKRSQKWADQFDEQENLLTKINEEDNQVSVIVVAIEEKWFNIKGTIDNLKKCLPNMDQLVIITHNFKEKILKRIINYINPLVINWKLDNMVLDTKPDALGMVHYGIRLVKNNWFLSLEAGDRIKEKDIRSIKQYLNVQSANFLAFYFDEDDPIKIFTNRYAFINMDGNNQLPWLDKVKTFDNWNQICLKIL